MVFFYRNKASTVKIMYPMTKTQREREVTNPYMIQLVLRRKGVFASRIYLA
jgi:hypothetical protein